MGMDGHACEVCLGIQVGFVILEGSASGDESYLLFP
jgi:hypothetical protein